MTEPIEMQGRRNRSAVCCFAVAAVLAPLGAALAEKPALRIGIIGLDTSHAIAFTKLFHDSEKEAGLQGFRVVAAYPKGSVDIESSVTRIPKYTEQMRGMGVGIVGSIDDLVGQVDAVLLETNDGRPHLEQALPVMRAGKPLFIDKPVAGSLSDAIAIFELARHYRVPVFSSSSLRYCTGAVDVRSGKIGKVLGATAYSPMSVEKTHPDLFWYGIHGVELLYTVMGTGCQSVVRTDTDKATVVTGVWAGGRIGTFRGLRTGRRGYGGAAFGQKGIADIGPFQGYAPLLVEVGRFFRTGKPPVSSQETLEIYAFMEAADESKRLGGASASVKAVMERARKEADGKLRRLLGAAWKEAKP
ncbi:MAG: Gfo/Idh/MocA family oxidoreductase [Phycisphaerae bacterium]|nr:Gfo/Idh/MocA family oxidoreductase [Phycisphaerae bacterium]